jgi:uncharacterized protein (TIGR00255 family)
MSVRSMTGFAMVRKATAQGEIVFSLKSVNHRGLDLQLHLPAELEGMEGGIRAALKSGLTRGHVQVNVTIERTGGPGAPVLNRALLDVYMRAFREAAGIYRVEGQPDLNSALRVPGMLSAGEAEALADDVAAAALEAAAAAVAALNQVREREGAATAEEIRQRCQNLGGLVNRMEEIRAGAAAAFHKRLSEKLAELLQGAPIDPQRLAQEAALLADRSDIAEELVRLRVHTAQVEEMLRGDGEVGKRLDFLLQEMNRESNTVLSKTGGLGELGLTITDLGLAAKSEIDKIREQSLNLE